MLHDNWYWDKTIRLVGLLAVVSASPLTAQERTAFERWDKDRDGFVSRAEFPSSMSSAQFRAADVDNDGRISKKEDEAFRNRAQNRERPNRMPPLPDGTQVKKDLVYERVGGRDLRLDLYLPPSKENLPLIIWVHGGGWRGGSKNSIQRARAVLDHGYALASVEYRLSGEAIFPAALEDCKAAVSFLRHKASEYQLDPEKFGAWGSSAGGHLVAMLGTTGDVEDFNSHPICQVASSRVQAVCNWFGPSDFLKMNDHPGSMDHNAPNSPESLFIGGPIQENQDLVGKANPITYVTRNDPPMLLMHGDRDQLVVFNQSELLYAALQKNKVESELVRVIDGGHGFRNARESSASLAKRVIEFFDQHLKIPQSNSSEEK